ESGADRVGGVDHQRVRLAQRQQPQAVVEIAVGQEDARDGRLPLRTRPQAVEALDLRPDLRRALDQEPGLAVTADGVRLLGARANARAASTRLDTIVAATVPLRET